MSERTLKETALLERIAEITATYEEKVADLRVEFTLCSQEKERLRVEVGELQREVGRLREGSEPVPDTIEGEVVQEEDE